ncbi:TIGR03087 family PEP-CTERM/XrtA system glycosyltransferase [Novosphingobium sp. PP1Y]|uniref:TIGR03087 family PEP-CTERM/XrtA system glycosyltransferase n=1 Tax=Novosphingobium sp. PP1Y TaxID=702113 RepID=UPI00020EF4FA|nr:TIGR03087 family PEP-CTERM/XrtA system glycosyltransferase [Novosphingobium sp. PP1Y]CCA93032.1 glycosyl transferase, group 1 [Novosphingobium sp. PP1Y]
MGEILFLSHRIPFPPDRGDKIRSHHVLKALAGMAPVHVATFADDEQDFASEADLAAIAASHRLLRRTKPLPLAAFEALSGGKPVSLTAFHDRRLKAWVRDTLRDRDIDVIYVFSGQMAQYVPGTFTGRVVADLVDVDSAKFDAYGANAKGLRSWIDRREGRVLGAEEARIVRRADASLLISPLEAELLLSRLPPDLAASAKVHAMGNGLDSTYFDPAVVKPEPRIVQSGGPRIIFTGQMDYAPNVAAVLRAIDRIMPAVRSACGHATLHVVGRNPVDALLARDGVNGTRIWGRVDDIRPWLAGADLALVPLEIARGVQNKVLEAMAMELPVILTPGAANGIDAVNGRDFRIADGDAAMAGAILAISQSAARRQAKGSAARRWIVENASWPAALARLPEFIGGSDARMNAVA